MFRAAATKLAHSSALPTQLTGNSDLRPLQEVIATQKQVMQSYAHDFYTSRTNTNLPPFSSLQKLTIDLTKSTDALRGWANTEGEDLEVCPEILPVVYNYRQGVPRTRFLDARPY